MDCARYGWDENTITFNILRRLVRTYSQVVIRHYAFAIDTQWELYKYSGKEENTFGDIAILVNIKYKSGREFTGVGLLEAKKRSQNSTRFDALKLPQLRSILRNAPVAGLALYDYERVADFPTGRDFYSDTSDTFLMQQDILALNHVASPYTHCLVVPMRNAIATGLRDTSLYAHALPFSQQVVNRYLLGFDLDPSPTAVQAARGFPTKGTVPRYVLSLSAGHDIVAAPQSGLFNDNLLERIRE